MIIVYRVSSLSYHLGKALIRVPHIGLVNLIAGRRIVPELVQHAVTPEAIAARAIDLLSQPSACARMRSDLITVRQRLGTAGASERVARIALDLVAAAPQPGGQSGREGIPAPCL